MASEFVGRERIVATLLTPESEAGGERLLATSRSQAAGSAELQIVPRNRAAQTLRRTGRVTVNPQVLFSASLGGETGTRHNFNLRLD